MTNNLTTNAGQPIADNQNSLTAGNRGPVLIQDYALLEKLAHFNRERIPERVVHAKGAGAKGIFTLTNDMSPFTKADLFNGVGKNTPLIVRFSQVAGEAGYPDTYRDVRGFAVKFYTQEGNYDIVGNNTPVFFIHDPLKFPDFIHSQKRHPKTHARSAEMQWDFWSHSPESVHQVTMLMGDRGIPASYRMMHGFGSHTFKWVNQAGEAFFVKYHFKTNQGVKNLSNDLAEQLAGKNTDYLQDDLYQAIEAGDFPSWTLYVQILPYEEGLNYKYDIFDVTKVVSQKDYPLIEVGTMTLDQNFTNNFEELEQLAFSPANLVPGIETSMDKLLQGRLFAYKDAHRYRLGANYENLKVNKPLVEVHNYERDGLMASGQTDEVNYEPNSFNGPKEVPSAKISGDAVHGETGNYAYDTDYYSAAGKLYRLFTPEEQTRLIETIALNLGQVKNKEIQIRQTKQFYLADPEYGERVANALDLNMDDII
ncbi:catalase [Listeria fleischmannii]|jgi:catalase|uniref:Catalase n=1 Tax=Listeria fleischmannii TaxID=1069827 RepID=A0A841YF72_9LIST|nr:catalase [Listeria fleischmannii]EIA21566.1 catalase [Listeria fleischmannii subsp. coloradonensis]MBC1398758.1 catalase [Listeria fleischmannii]MBC1426899.1 catalase [Listeria fleischmannii]STY35892.1 Vegetative catalase [Listeria fleischmannii subsp. coloradonensis]